MKIKSATVNDQDYIVPDDGVYRAELTKIEDAGLSTYANERTGEFEHRFKVTWTIRDPESEYDEVEVCEWFNSRTATYNDPSTGKQSKFYPFLKAHLGRDYNPDIDEDENGDFDLDVLVGSHVMLTLQAKTKKNGKTFSNPVSAAPIRKKKAAAPPAKPVKQVVEEDEDDESIWEDVA